MSGGTVTGFVSPPQPIVVRTVSECDNVRRIATYAYLVTVFASVLAVLNVVLIVLLVT